MPPIVINPAALHDPVPYGYSHLVDTGAAGLIVVAGQYAADADGRLLSTDFDTQVERSFDNLGTALAAVGLGFGDVVRLGTYIVGHDAARLAGLCAVVDRIWGDRPPAQTLLGVAGLALPGMLFEVDALAVRG
ncbi:enamine deaminase RidA (YjgF/YER057c/UK114 family) [Actinoalloteichus hoggarensis]|uniref:Endoribonuclease L-PSP n=1 Tax=Actinoalloteichus hoggarensis TaxID=1470176 RepID=A0A221W3L9_9PSEU|nr:Rid family hydrolase [Actinoalloteichus hoggarensis]ASO20425.1 Endoribonuclease L-PSP [Actinoalloteichus hoggarensis]MBB5923464.1 enamine deaminase RidA (YjgF/YER057c/UK114 family) [Actinoalloteichus hoggarensis]